MTVRGNLLPLTVAQLHRSRRTAAGKTLTWPDLASGGYAGRNEAFSVY